MPPDVEYSMVKAKEAYPTKAVRHSFVATAEAFNAMRSTGIEQSHELRAEKLEKVNAKLQDRGRPLTWEERREYKIVVEFTSEEFTEINHAIMERDGWGKLYVSGKLETDIGVHEGVQGFKAIYEPLYCRDTNSYIYAEKTVYPDDCVHKDAFGTGSCPASSRLNMPAYSEIE
jgi:hypothetical protein